MTEQDLITRARSLYEERRFDEAERIFAQLLETPTSRGSALYGLALINIAQGQYDRAKGQLALCLKVDRRNANASYYLGRIAEREGNFNDAVAMYGGALLIDPRHAALAALANLNARRQKPESSRDSGPVDGPPSAPKHSDSFVGVVRQLHKGTVPYRGAFGSWVQWTFLLEPYDDDGRRQPPLPVDMRGTEIRGVLEEGHWVEIEARARKNTGLDPKRIRNLTTRSEVRRVRHVLYAR